MIGVVSAEHALTLLQHELGKEIFTLQTDDETKAKAKAIRLLYSLGVIPRTMQYISEQMKTSDATQTKSLTYLESLIVNSYREKYPPRQFTDAISSQNEHRYILQMLINRQTTSWPSDTSTSEANKLIRQLAQGGLFWVRRIVKGYPEILVPYFLRWSWLDAMSNLKSPSATPTILRVLRYQKAICEPATLAETSKGPQFEEVVAVMIASRMLLCLDESKYCFF